MDVLLFAYLSLPFLYRTMTLKYKVQIVPVYIKDSLKEDGWFIMYGYNIVCRGGFDFQSNRMVKPKFASFNVVTPDKWNTYKTIKKIKVHVVTMTLLFFKYVFTPHIKLFKFIESKTFVI
jgi:hypothetical protein